MESFRRTWWWSLTAILALTIALHSTAECRRITDRVRRLAFDGEPNVLFDDDIEKESPENETSVGASSRQMRIGLLNGGAARNMSLNLSSLVVLGLGVAAAVSLFSYFDSSSSPLFKRRRRRRDVDDDDDDELDRLLDILPYTGNHTGKGPCVDDVEADNVEERLSTDDMVNVMDDSLRLVCDLMGLLCTVPDALEDQNVDGSRSANASSSKADLTNRTSAATDTNVRLRK